MERFDQAKGRILTVREVSRYLRVHPTTVYKLLKKNQLPAFKVGADWRFHVDAIDRWCASLASGAPLTTRQPPLKGK